MDPEQSLLSAAPEEKLLEAHETSLLSAHKEAPAAAAATATAAAAAATAATAAAPKASVVDEAPIENMVEPKKPSWSKGAIAAIVIAAVALIGIVVCLGYINDKNPEPYYTNAAYKNANHAAVASSAAQDMATVPVVYRNGHYYPAAGDGGAHKDLASAVAASTGSQVAVPVVVYLFNFDSDGVPENPTLSSMAKAAKDSGKTIYIKAYTDERGNRGYNQALSQRRANAIGDYMEKHGVPADHVKAAGYGPTHKYPSDMQNRRAELTLK